MLLLWLRVSAAGRANGGPAGGHIRPALDGNAVLEPTSRRAAEVIRRHGTMAEEALRLRAARAGQRSLKLEMVCRDAWERSAGGERMPNFRNLSGVSRVKLAPARA